MAGDRAADVLARHTGLAAQQRDQHSVDVLLAELRAAVGEQHVDELAGLSIRELGLCGPNCLPRLDRSPTTGSTGLVNAVAVLLVGHVEQTHVRSPPAPVVGLPADRADPQSDDLVDAQSGEQPQQRDRADELERIPRPDRPVA